MILAAIDPSLGNTAIVVSDPNNGPEAFQIKCFGSPPAGNSLVDRVRRYESFVGRIVKHLEQHAVTHVFLEGYSYGSTGAGVVTLGELGSILRWHLIPPQFQLAVEVPPTSVKKFATGNGSAKKEVVAAEIARRYNVSLASSDEFDAYSIWRFARVYLGIDPPATKFQADAVESVKNPAPPKKRKKQKRQLAAAPPPSDDLPF